MQVKYVKGGMLAQEAKRRAAILERYLAIELPTAEDDGATAAELGLSVDSMIRLASVWRRHRSEGLLVGQVAALAGERPAQRNAVMAEEIDLDGVRPDRRVEILRRIRIMQEHLASAEHDQVDAAEAARKVGVSVERFHILLRTWLLHARAEALPGATRRGTPWRRQPNHARRLKLLHSTLADAAPGTSRRAVYDAFVAACISEGLKPLGLKRFYGIVHDLRGAGANRREESS